MAESRVRVDGVEMVYESEGAGPPVLLVHGNLGSSRWWSRSMDLPGFRAVAVELPNFARSSPLPGYDPSRAELADYADSLAAFIEATGLAKPVLVGHSLGGGVALSLAARRPELLRALVLVDSAAPSGLLTPRERHPAIEAMRADPRILAAALRAVVPTLADEALFAELVADAGRMAAPAWIGNAEALSRLDLRGRLGAFHGPVLVVWGRKDAIVTEAMARETAAAFPAARLEIVESVGHSIMVEDPALWRTLLMDFLSGLDA